MSAVSRHIRQPDPRAAEANGTAKRVWLLLYTEGGLWTAEEIGKRLQIARPLWNALGEMVRGRFLVRHRGTSIDGDLIVKFAVTRKCKVPRGVVVEEIEELLQMAHGRRA